MSTNNKKPKPKYDEEFKKNAVKLSHHSSKSIADTARDLGISEERLYAWRKRYTENGDATKFADKEDELKAARIELARLRMENDMLKKATAYFANLQN